VRKIVLLGVLSLAVAMVAPSVAGADDVNGPPCADIVGQGSNGESRGSYSADGTVSVVVALAAPACSKFEYAVTVITAGGPQALALVGTNASGDLLFFSGTVDPTLNDTVCLYATTSVGGDRHVFDRAPNGNDCVLMPKSGSPGFAGFD
jgi:hypothetical protein